MTEKPHELAALRLLGKELDRYEQEREERLAAGEDRPIVDREAAQQALTAVSAFLFDQGIETTSLNRLLSELVALTAGANPSPMLAPFPTSHRRPEAPGVESLKGRLAALMEYRQRTGSTRKEAAAWVVRYMPAAMARSLGGVQPATVSSWLSKWGGERGAQPGDGREGYEAMRAILVQHQPGEAELIRVLISLERH